MPGINHNKITCVEVRYVARRDFSASHLSNRCDLRICMTDRPAERAPASNYPGIGSRSVALEVKDLACKILGKQDFRRGQQRFAPLALAQYFDSIKDLRFVDTSRKEFS